MCLRGSSYEMEIVAWADVSEALDAVRTLFDRPCAARCQGEHLLVFTDVTAIHARKIVGPPQPKRSLGALLTELYPSRLNGNGHSTLDSTPELWPIDPELNPPLRPKGRPVNPETEKLKAAQDAAIADCHREMEPVPGGVKARAEAARAEADTSIDPMVHRYALAMEAAARYP